MQHARPRASLIQRLSLSIWGLFLLLLLLLTTLGWLAMRAAADRAVPWLAQRTVDLHARADEGLFQHAEASVRRLQAELLRRLDAADPDATQARFSTLFARSPDGLWRLRPELVDVANAPTLYLHQPPRGLTPSAKIRAVVSHDLLREQGPALVPPFYSAYMDFVEDGLMVYARDKDWGSAADASYTNTGYPTMQGSEPRHNPARKVFWTPVYQDRQANAWMVSVIKPLDWHGQWVGTVGHDVSVQTLLDTIAASHDDEGTRLIVDADGNLIAHPHLRERIAAADGHLQLANLNEPALTQAFALLSGSHADSGVGRTADGRQWVAWSKMRGPGWYQVYLLPQARVDNLLLWGLLGFFGLGVLGLLPVVWLLRRRVRRLFAAPLQRLTLAVDALGQGRTPAPIAMQGDDELGRLAGAFDAMVEELTQQHALQATHAHLLQTEVDERRQFMTRLEEERARLLALLGAMKRGILFADANGRVTYCNTAFLDLWKLPTTVSLAGHFACDVFDMTRSTVVDKAGFQNHVRKALSNHDDSSQFETALQDARILLLGSHPVRDAQGRHIGWLWIHEDVTHERQTAEQLIQLAERDTLTGLHNRRKFEDVLTEFFRGTERTPSQAALLFFDLDEFKYINDTFGHRAGDAVLARIATEAMTLVRDDDLLFRLGGDEFAVLMPHASISDAQHLAERIVRKIAQTPLVLQDRTLQLTTSLGIAHYPTLAGNMPDLLAHADTAMYQAKHLGKNRWRVYHPDRDAAQEMLAHMGWNDRIARALEHNLLRLHFQGIYRAHNGHLAHLEALVRMVDEANPDTLIQPAQFIGHAEKSGRILDIDRWVIRESIQLLASHPHLPALAINVSGRSFDDPELSDYISAQLHEHHVSPKRLLVELTETSAVTDLSDASRFIDALRRTGCTICLDDFGTGFSSFAYLKYIKADVLKIDGMFIRDLPHMQDNQVFVRAIIDVARGMGKQTVAEFVEDGKTLLMLRELGVDMVQGFHLDRPRANHPAFNAPPTALQPG